MPIGRTREESQEIMVGALVVVVAVLLGAWIHYGPSQASANGYDLQVHIPKTDGLGKDTDVRISGVKVGSITSLSLDPHTYLATVHMNIQSEFRIPVDSAMAVTSNGILGNPYITIVPGSSKVVLPSGGTIVKSCGAEDVMSMVGRIGLSNGMGNCPKH